MKDFACRFFQRFNPLIFDVITKLFRLINFFRIAPRALVFTDSRGFEVLRPWNRRNPFSSYVSFLMAKYACDVYLCPKRHTSLLDFLDVYESASNDYDVVVLHCGIVDFAPRPEHSFDEMYFAKVALLEKYGIAQYFNKRMRHPGCEYEGEPTYSFMSEEFVEEFIIPKLVGIKNLIYIGINPVLSEWRGNYWRERPSNINSQLKQDEKILSAIEKVINLSDKSDDWVKLNTVDNIHLSREGFNYIVKELSSLGV